MKLNLLDVNEFITKNNCLEVQSSKFQLGEKKIDLRGLFSEEIFGRLATNERKRKFGFINLKTKLIHPEAWGIVCGLDPIVSKILNNKQTYIITDDGLLKEDPAGDTGVYFFCKNIDKINFKKFKRDNKVDFFNKNKNKILIDKWLVLPAGVRDIQISRSEVFTKMESAEVNKLYDKLLKQTNSFSDDVDNLPIELSSMMITNLQRTLLEINDWIKHRLEGKTGLIRGGLISKPTDYSARLVITPDPELQVGQVGIPWQVVLKLFEPFSVYYILNKEPMLNKLIQEFIKSDTKLDSNSVKRFIGKINENPDIIPAQTKEYLIHAAREIAHEKIVLYKRDPVENRDSWVAANIKVNSKGYILKLNPVDCPRNGADFDGDAMAIFPLFTKEATKEAKKKLHPRYSTGNWNVTTNYDSLGYPIDLDAAAAIYMATKQ